eukprot:12958903-Ditylum_brightwellii.AAC.1
MASPHKTSIISSNNSRRKKKNAMLSLSSPFSPPPPATRSSSNSSLLDEKKKVEIPTNRASLHRFQSARKKWEASKAASSSLGGIKSMKIIPMPDPLPPCAPPNQITSPLTQRFNLDVKNKGGEASAFSFSGVTSPPPTAMPSTAFSAASASTAKTNSAITKVPSNAP